MLMLVHLMHAGAGALMYADVSAMLHAGAMMHVGVLMHADADAGACT